jgi:hypothetical protein
MMTKEGEAMPWPSVNSPRKSTLDLVQMLPAMDGVRQ